MFFRSVRSAIQGMKTLNQMVALVRPVTTVLLSCRIQQACEVLAAENMKDMLIVRLIRNRRCSCSVVKCVELLIFL